MPPRLEALEERTLPSGSGLDPSFGTGGRVVSDFGNSNRGAEAVARQPDGKLVVAGSGAQDASGQPFVVARYLADGSLDTTFGSNGKVTTDFGSPSTSLTGSCSRPMARSSW